MAETACTTTQRPEKLGAMLQLPRIMELCHWLEKTVDPAPSVDKYFCYNPANETYEDLSLITAKK